MEFSTILNSDLLNFQTPDLSAINLFRRLGSAVVLGTILSIVIRQTFSAPKKVNNKLQRTLVTMQHTHILVCLGGAFIMIIIGNSLANAFALTGALSMVRFRTALIDPKEAAIIILFIAIGMACGLDLFLAATVMTALTSVLVLAMFLQYQWLKRRQSRNKEDQDDSPEDSPPKSSEPHFE